MKWVVVVQVITPDESAAQPHLLGTRHKKLIKHSIKSCTTTGRTEKDRKKRRKKEKNRKKEEKEEQKKKEEQKEERKGRTGKGELLLK